ncbi:hypothetical protein, partial [Microcoleus sp. Pol12A6]|uniref:hypothetical protein n=1 Tax=Microcoleus sp. Pol12A6 TaxID=3055393 RepID=UPI002FD51096
MGRGHRHLHSLSFSDRGRCVPASGGLPRKPICYSERPDPPGNLHYTAIEKTQTKTPKTSLSRKEKEELTV